MYKKITFLFIILVLGGGVPYVQAQTYVISTVAGDGIGSDSGDGGLAIKAGLNQPWGLAVDDSGNLYIGDQNNSKVRKVNTKGIITTVAGCDTCYYLNDGHLATQSEVAIPLGVAIDTSGLYIAEFGDRRIRKVDNKGIIHTYAGTGKGGFSGDGGPATAAMISEPYGIALDKFGNLYICDAFNNVIRKVDKAGIITTFAGDTTKGYSGDGGLATNAELNTPTGVAVDTIGNVYISNYGWVRKVNIHDSISTYAGNGSIGSTGDGGPAPQAQIGYPFDCATDDSGNVYVMEYRGNYVRKIYPDDTITTIGGDGIQAYSNYYGNPDTASMYWPLGIIVDHFGNVYFSDSNNALVRELSPCSPDVLTAPLSPEICIGQSVTLSVKGRNTYSWSPGASITDSTEGGLSVIASPTVTTTYTISGTTCFASATIVVTVDTLPVVVISPSPATFCPGESVTLTASGASSYAWSPATSLSDTTGSSVIANPSVATTYTVTGTTALGCIAQPATVAVTISVAPNQPSITKSVTGDTLISSATNGNQWYVNDTIIKGATDSILVITGEPGGSYKVVVTDVANGCSTTSAPLVTSGIGQLSLSSAQVALYPNPTSGLVTITAAKPIDDVIVTDLLGQVIKTLLVEDSGVINLAKLPDGIYFISVLSDSHTITQKLVITK